VIANSARGFGDEAAIPVIGMQPIPDLDLSWQFSVMVKTTVADDRVFSLWNDGKLRGNAGAIPADNFLDESDRLFAFGENA